MACGIVAGPRLAGADEPAVSAPGTRPAWTLAGHVGVSIGSHTDPSFAWRAGVHRWVSEAASVGVEVVRLRWVDLRAGLPRYAVASIGPFKGLAKGGNELQGVSLGLRLHAQATGPHQSAPVLALGAGLYRQVVRNRFYYSGSDKLLDHKIRMGVSFAVGGAATRGIAPGAEIRFEYIDTEPTPSSYFTVSAAILANR